MKTYKFMIVACCLVILIGGVMIIKANAFGPHHPGGGFPGLRVLMELDLSDAQKSEVRAIISKYREDGKEIRGQLREAREMTMDVMHDEPFVEEKVRQAFQQVSPLLEEGMVMRARLMAEIRSLLNPDQLESLKEKRIEMSGKIKEDMRFRESMIGAWLQMGTE